MSITMPERRYTVEELLMSGDWVKEHGDPADWCKATHEAYEKAVAALHARLGGVS